MKIENLTENLEKYVDWQLRLELLGEHAHCFQGKIGNIEIKKDTKDTIEVKFKWVVQDLNYLAGKPQWRTINFITEYFLPLFGLQIEQDNERIKFQVMNGHQGMFLPSGDPKYIAM